MRTFSQTCRAFAPLVLILILSVVSCRRSSSPTVAPDDEQRVFELVALPSAEGDYATALHVSDSLLSTVAMGDTLRAYVMIERNVAQINSGDYDAASLFADSLIAYGRRTGISDAEIQGLKIKGVCHRRSGDYERAIDYYKEGLALAERDGNMEQEQTFADLIAVIYVEQKRYDEALTFARRSLDLAEELGDTFTIVSAVSTLGSIYTSDNRYAEAIEALAPYAGMTVDIHPLLQVKYITPLMSSYLELDSLDRAEELIDRAADAAAMFGEDHMSWSVVLNAKAMLAGKRHRYSEQLRLYTLMDSLGTHGRPAETMLAEEAQCLANMGDYARAYEKMCSVRVELNANMQSDLREQLSELSVQYDTLEKEMEIERLNHQRWLLVNAIVVCVVVIVAIVSGAVMLRRRARRRYEREKQQQYVNGLEQERTRIGCELHDDIAGSLVALQWDADRLPADEIAGRIGSIAGQVRSLSHRLMPPEFVNQTFPQLLLDFVARFKNTHDTPRITVTDEGTFDWNGLSPESSRELYRVVQEAVNNAMRHAAPTSITITLGGSDRFTLSVENDGVKPGTVIADNAHNTIRARAAILSATLKTDMTDSTYKLTIIQK